MTKPAPRILENASLQELRDALRAYQSRSLCVVDGDGKLIGIVTLSDLQRAYRTDLDEATTVGSICSRNPVNVAPDDEIWTAIKIMGVRDVGRLPVIDRSTGELVGLIGRNAVMRAYNLAVEHKLQDQHIAEHIRLNALTGGHVFEFHVESGSAADGKHIADIHWPQESVVAAIQRGRKQLIPRGDTEIKANDSLTIIADPELESVLTALLK